MRLRLTRNVGRAKEGQLLKLNNMYARQLLNSGCAEEVPEEPPPRRRRTYKRRDLEAEQSPPE